MTKSDALVSPHKSRGTPDTGSLEQWFYLGKRRCTFHNNNTGGHFIEIPTRQLVKALRDAGLLSRKKKAK